ncbi:MAG: TonB family protein [Candidatus Coatesbacteria bacterium]|nr:MAG: TonB family protein [Candidatus Coatesbacteria bacterium]
MAEKKAKTAAVDAHATMRVRVDKLDKKTMAIIYAATFLIFVLWVISLFYLMGGGGFVAAIVAGAVTVLGFVWFYIFFLGKHIRFTLTIAIAVFGVIWFLAAVPKTLVGGGEGPTGPGGKIKMDVVKKKYDELPPPPTIEEPTEAPKGLETKGAVGSIPLPVPDEEADAETIADMGPGVEEGEIGEAEIEVVDEVVDADMSAPNFDVEYSEAPYPIHDVKPKYPEIAKASGWEGDVMLLVYIDRDGSVKNVVVAGSSGFSDVDKEATDAAYKCRFSPAKQQGVPVGVWYQIIMEFRL